MPQIRAKPALFDRAGRPLHLGSELGRGGEGTVYEERDRSDEAVKLYNKPLDPEKSAKIATMAKFGNERLLKLTAWPTEPIRVGSGTGPIAGFIMPKITGHKQAFNLYSPKLRPQEFPTAGWQFPIRSAANAARAFMVVHESGHVIGDVKHDNLLVGGNATVRLIDCDSYQITINGSRWFCEVGTPTHQPPELQNIRTYKGVVRTPNHDDFGLAVIIFQMLFMAQHPFSGRFLGTGEMPMERAISEYRFAHGANAAAMQMQPPPASLGLNGVTRDVGLLFERAFSRQGSQPNGRPRPDEWVTALQDLEQHLNKCAVNPAHQFVDTLSKCPWCEIEAAAGVPLFQVAIIGAAQTGFTIAAFWAKVNSVPNPGPPPPLPSIEAQTVSLSPAAMELQQATLGAKIVSGLLALIGQTSRIDVLTKEIKKRAVDALSRWPNIKSNWDAYTDSKDYDDLLSYLQNLREQYNRLPQKRLQSLQTLEANRYQLQLRAHLDRCRISHARIRGIGDARKATLQSYGIETAADIVDHRVLAVPGFGPVALNHLKQWRNQQERRFLFDPNRGVDQSAKNAVERQILTEKLDLERKLNESLSKLTVSSHHILTQRRTFLARAEQAAHDLAQAKADLRAASTILPVVPGKRVIIALGAISIGGLIIAHQGRGLPPVIQQQPYTHTTPSGITYYDNLPAPAPTVPPQQVPPQQVQPRPQNQYTPSPVTSRQPYTHTTPSGITYYDNLPAPAPTVPPQQVPPQQVPPQQVQPRPQNQYASPPPASPFDQGMADRAEWEQWVAALSGDFRSGAEWWAGHRSLPSPGACNGPAAAMNQQFILGCEAAKLRLTPRDIKRKSDPDYRRGWNSYTDTTTPSPAPDSHAPTVDQGASAVSPDTDADAAKRLNQQELKRMRDHQ